jgi:hypothetical protein
LSNSDSKCVPTTWEFCWVPSSSITYTGT